MLLVHISSVNMGVLEHFAEENKAHKLDLVQRSL